MCSVMVAGSPSSMLAPEPDVDLPGQRPAPGLDERHPAANIGPCPCPRRFSAARATPVSSAAVSPSDCSARTRTCRIAGVSRSSSPRRTVPAGSVPVTTVPLPVMLNARSTHSRTGALGGSGRAARPARPAQRGGQLGQARPVTALTATAGTSPRLDRGELRPRPASWRGRVGQVGPGDHEQAVA